MNEKLDKLKEERKALFTQRNEARKANNAEQEEKISKEMEAKKEEYDKEFSSVYGCPPKSLRKSFMLKADTRLAGMRVDPKAMDIFWRAVGREVKSTWNKYVEFAKSNGSPKHLTAELAKKCSMKRISEEEKAKRKAEKSLSKHGDKIRGMMKKAGISKQEAMQMLDI